MCFNDVVDSCAQRPVAGIFEVAGPVRRGGNGAVNGRPLFEVVENRRASHSLSNWFRNYFNFDVMFSEYWYP